MERRVKERLIGAAVLMAAAVILIPEMLSGPEREEQAQPAQTVGAPAIKTYTIDMNQPASSPGPAVIEERAPPPEPSPAAPQPNPDSGAAPAAAVKAEPKPGRETAVGEAPAPAPTTAPAEPPAAKPAATLTPPMQSAPLATAPAAPTTRGWAVQIGSFSREDTAQRLANELRGAGHGAFVMPVQGKSGAMYRVRVGPMKDRASAEAALSALKGRAPGAAVVANP